MPKVQHNKSYTTHPADDIARAPAWVSCYLPQDNTTIYRLSRSLMPQHHTQAKLEALLRRISSKNHPPPRPPCAAGHWERCAYAPRCVSLPQCARYLNLVRVSAISLCVRMQSHSLYLYLSLSPTRTEYRCDSLLAIRSSERERHTQTYTALDHFCRARAVNTENYRKDNI